MLSSCSVACPNEHCSWTGSLVPWLLQGGKDEEIVSMQKAWFQCPRCKSDWEMRVINDDVTALTVAEGNSWLAN